MQHLTLALQPDQLKKEAIAYVNCNIALNFSFTTNETEKVAIAHITCNIIAFDLSFATSKTEKMKL